MNNLGCTPGTSANFALPHDEHFRNGLVGNLNGYLMNESEFHFAQWNNFGSNGNMGHNTSPYGYSQFMPNGSLVNGTTQNMQQEQQQQFPQAQSCFSYQENSQNYLDMMPHSSHSHPSSTHNLLMSNGLNGNQQQHLQQMPPAGYSVQQHISPASIHHQPPAHLIGNGMSIGSPSIMVNGVHSSTFKTSPYSAPSEANDASSRKRTHPNSVGSVSNQSESKQQSNLNIIKLSPASATSNEIKQSANMCTENSVSHNRQKTVATFISNSNESSEYRINLPPSYASSTMPSTSAQFIPLHLSANGQHEEPSFVFQQQQEINYSGAARIFNSSMTTCQTHPQQRQQLLSNSSVQQLPQNQQRQHFTDNESTTKSSSNGVQTTRQEKQFSDEHILQPSTSYHQLNQERQQHFSEVNTASSQSRPEDRSNYGVRTAATMENVLANGTAELTEEMMLNYLKNPSKYDCVVTIFHAKVAQKSYGNEKRFFTPPPTVYLHGGGWQRVKRLMEMFAANIPPTSARNPTTDASIVNNNKFNNGKNLAQFVAFIGITDLDQEKLLLDFSREDFATAKSLHISDSDKRKYFTLKLHLFFDILGQKLMDVGEFESHRTKVISKPAKRKQSTKNNDCRYQSISSGTKVALFNRVRSQTGSTRFLHVYNGKFNANQKKWGVFRIHLYDTKDRDTKTDQSRTSFSRVQGTIHYGDVVILEDFVSELSLPPLIIRKVDKTGAMLKPGDQEPVNQLHKCAFEMYEERKSYITLDNEFINKFSSKVAEESPHHHICPDTATWVIIAAHTTEYRFYEPIPLPRMINNPMMPVPIVSSAELIGDGTDSARLFIEGQNFYPLLSVWIGCTPVQTFVTCRQVLNCAMPALTKLNRASAEIIKVKSLDLKNQFDCRVTFPITLVRSADRIIYGTTLKVTYTYTTSNEKLPDHHEDSEELKWAVIKYVDKEPSHAFETPAFFNTTLNVPFVDGDVNRCD